MCLCQNNTPQKSTAKMMREQTDIYAIQKIDSAIVQKRSEGMYLYLYPGQLPETIINHYKRQGFYVTETNNGIVRFEWHHV